MKPLTTTPSFCANVEIPANHCFYSQFNSTCMPIQKTSTTSALGCTASTPKPYDDQISLSTPCLDSDNVYGNTESQAKALRTLSGGFLITRNNGYPPLQQGCAIPPNTRNGRCYQTGDVRANQNLDLVINQIGWLRFHNWCCRIMAPINPHWDDERMYQECRRISIAVHQHIAFNEVFPAVIGHKAMYDKNLLYPYNSLTGRSKYNDSCELNPLNEFSNGAYRILHALIVTCLKMANEDRDSLGHLKFIDHLNNPTVLEQNNTYDHLIRGGSCQRTRKVGPSFDSDITSRIQFFLSIYKQGLDLLAIDLERSRLHGIPSYNTIRAKCGLRNATTFNEFDDSITPERIAILASIYKNHSDVDYIIGGLMETPVDNALVGPSVVCVFQVALERMSTCDRFWFDNDQKHFSNLQLESIRTMNMATLLCLTGDNIKYMQHNAMEPPGITNPLIPCLLQPPMTLEPFREINIWP